jgi:hypothetical protein
LSGIGAYFLTRHDDASLLPILARLADLLRAGDPLSAWHTPVELLDDDARRRYPASYVNCGLAHGVPGPLALLSLADAEGVDVAGLSQAIEQAAAWLVEHIVEDEWGVNWPAVVPRARRSSRDGPTRAAWCYGVPGIARTLWLAGAARADSGLQDLAVAALETVFRRPAAARRVDAPTFCHGLAGLLQITLRIANDAGNTPLRVAGGALAAELVDRFDPDSILGYRDVDAGGLSADNAGLLQGAAGVALVLLAAAAPVPSRWDRMFLLS